MVIEHKNAYPLYINKEVDIIESIMLKYVRLPEDVGYLPSTRIPTPYKDFKKEFTYSKMPYYSFMCLPMVETAIQLDFFNKCSDVLKAQFRSNPLSTTIDAERMSFTSEPIYAGSAFKTIDEVILQYIEEIADKDFGLVLDTICRICDYTSSVVNNKVSNIYSLDYDYNIIMLLDYGEVGSYRLNEFEKFRQYMEVEYEEKIDKDVSMYLN